MDIRTVCEIIKEKIVRQANLDCPEVFDRFCNDTSEKNLEALWGHPDWKVAVIRANIAGFQNGDVTVVKNVPEGILAYSDRTKANVLLDASVTIEPLNSAGF